MLANKVFDDPEDHYVVDLHTSDRLVFNVFEVILHFTNKSTAQYVLSSVGGCPSGY